MCGIFAVVDLADPLPPRSAQLEALSMLQHRGPDWSGVVERGACVIGASRLSITGLVHSDQPLHEGCLTVALNGEIYNYRELRAELIAGGAVFSGDGDTEVALKALLAWGGAAFPRFDGMFAIAAWDSSTETLTLARDRFGEKPLSYSVSGSRCLAASEVTVLVEAFQASDVIDPSALLDLGTHWYIDVPRSVYRDIRQVPPGHVVRFGRDGLDIEDWRQRDDIEIAHVDLLPELDQALRCAVDSRTPTSEQSGLLLSSGIDSGLIATYAAELGRDVLAISTSFSEPGYDESPVAATLAASLGIPHITVPVDLSTFDLPQRVYGQLDEPLADASILGAFAAAEASAQAGLRVVLGGDGGDELFGGYPTYSADLLKRRLPRLPAGARRGAIALAALVPNGRHPIGRRHRLQQFVGALHLDPAAAHSAWRSVSRTDERAAVFSPLADNLAGYDPYARSRAVFSAHGSEPWLERMLAIDQATWLPGDHLRKTDRAFMAFAIETRAPFLADSVRRISKSIPPCQKADIRSTKKALRALARTRLPGGIASLPKRGWTAPTDALMRTCASDTWELLTSGLAAEVTSRSAMSDLWRGFLSGRGEHGRLLWSLASLSIWGRSHRWSLE